MIRKTIIFFFGLFLAITAQSSEISMNCDSETSSPKILETAFRNVYSFEYVKGALTHAASSSPKICVTGWPVSKNQYQYFRFLMLATTDANETFAFLYQDASTQANHNVGGKAWVGLSPAQVTSVFEKIKASAGEPLATLNLHPSVQETVIAYLASAPAYKYKLDLNTFSFAALPGLDKNGEKNYLVVWFDKLVGSNPFTQYPISHAMLVVVNESQAPTASLHKVSLLSDVVTPLDEMLTHEARSAYRSGDLVGYLRDLAKRQQ